MAIVTANEWVPLWTWDVLTVMLVIPTPGEVGSGTQPSAVFDSKPQSRQLDPDVQLAGLAFW